MPLQMLTWMVSTLDEDGHRHAICAEATSWSRMRLFAARHLEWQEVAVPFGLFWTGEPLNPTQLHAIKNGIARNAGRSKSSSDVRRRLNKANAVMGKVAKIHGIAVEALRTPPSKEARYARARGHAVHLLKQELPGISAISIAMLLNYKDQKSVHKWLKRPIEEFLPTKPS